MLISSNFTIQNYKKTPLKEKCASNVSFTCGDLNSILNSKPVKKSMVNPSVEIAKNLIDEFKKYLDSIGLKVMTGKYSGRSHDDLLSAVIHDKKYNTNMAHMDYLQKSNAFSANEAIINLMAKLNNQVTTFFKPMCEEVQIAYKSQLFEDKYPILKKMLDSNLEKYNKNRSPNADKIYLNNIHKILGND